MESSCGSCSNGNSTYVEPSRSNTGFGEAYMFPAPLCFRLRCRRMAPASAPLGETWNSSSMHSIPTMVRLRRREPASGTSAACSCRGKAFNCVCKRRASRRGNRNLAMLYAGGFAPGTGPTLHLSRPSGSKLRLLLISNTGRPPFAHCRDHIRAFMGEHRTAAFIGAARLGDEGTYFESVHNSLMSSGTTDELLHLRWDDPDHAILEEVSTVIVGGGNTYVLLQRLTASGLLRNLRDRFDRGLSYIGASAGANIAGPNILTTNDWNVVGSTSFSSLGIVPFNINPHYVFRRASDGATGESRDDRIAEYHEVQDNAVVAIEEDTLLRIEDDAAEVLGSGGVKFFEKGQTPRWLSAGERLQPIRRLGSARAPVQ